MKQPGQAVWQIFDAKTAHLLRDEYHIRQITKVKSTTLEDLVKQLDDVDTEACLAEIKAFNASVKKDVHFEFMGVPGACACMVFLPLVCYLWVAVCNPEVGCLGWSVESVRATLQLLSMTSALLRIRTGQTMAAANAEKTVRLATCQRNAARETMPQQGGA